MITIILQGGLGNQLFQIFTVISYAIQNNIDFYFFQIKNKNVKRPFYWDNFLINLKPYIKTEPTINKQAKILKEKHFGFNLKMIDRIQNNLKIFQNICLDGYFQTPLYFNSYKREICNIIGMDNIISNLNIPYYKNKTSIHFRLGDYKHLQGCHPILPIKYYIDSINHLIKHYNNNVLDIVYFFEHDDITIINENISILKKEFKNINFLPCDNSLSDWEQLLCMSLCENNIIANSTFSWWSAYLNKNKDKLIIYPSIWFGPLINNNTKDLFDDSWVKINI